MINQSKTLEKLGIACFGNSWKASLADALNIARPTITDWLTGKKPIPVGIWADIKLILEKRNLEINEALLVISGKHLIVLEEMQRKGKAVILGSFAESLLNLQDEQILLILDAYKHEFARCSKEHPNDIFADLSTIKDALDFNIIVRDLDGNLDLSLAEDCAFSFAENKKRALSFGINDELLIERVDELLEMKENG